MKKENGWVDLMNFKCETTDADSLDKIRSLWREFIESRCMSQIVWRVAVTPRYM